MLIYEKFVQLLIKSKHPQIIEQKMARSFLLLALLKEAYELDVELMPIRPTRIRRNISLCMSKEECVNMYRLSEDLIFDLEADLIPYIPANRRKDGLPVRTKILCTLSFLASGDFQKIVGIDLRDAISQPTTSRALHQVIDAICQPDVVKRFIKFPQNSADIQKLKDRFHEKFGIPNVIGCIDSTLVNIVRPKHNENQYFIQKGQHALNVQLICDADFNIIYVNSSFGGALDDSSIFNQSSIKNDLEKLHNAGEIIYLLGDSNYPQTPYLMTPIPNAEPGTPESHYNKIHAAAHRTSEKLIRVLKGRFRCLLGQRMLYYQPDKVSKIVIACCVLHNMCNKSRLRAPRLSEKEIEDEKKYLLLAKKAEFKTESNCDSRSSLVDFLSQSRT